MTPIKVGLKKGDTGPDVTNLQDALAALVKAGTIPLTPSQQQGMEQFKQEYAKNTFGDTTMGLVRIFCQQPDSHVTFHASVDQACADALDAALKSKGLIDQPLPK